MQTKGLRKIGKKTNKDGLKYISQVSKTRKERRLQNCRQKLSWTKLHSSIMRKIRVIISGKYVESKTKYFT